MNNTPNSATIKKTLSAKFRAENCEFTARDLITTRTAEGFRVAVAGYPLFYNFTYYNDEYLNGWYCSEYFGHITDDEADADFCGFVGEGDDLNGLLLHLGYHIANTY